VRLTGEVRERMQDAGHITVEKLEVGEHDKDDVMIRVLVGYPTGPDEGRAEKTAAAAIPGITNPRSIAAIPFRSEVGARRLNSASRS